MKHSENVLDQFSGTGQGTAGISYFGRNEYWICCIDYAPSCNMIIFWIRKQNHFQYHFSNGFSQFYAIQLPEIFCWTEPHIHSCNYHYNICYLSASHTNFFLQKVQKQLIICMAQFDILMTSIAWSTDGYSSIFWQYIIKYHLFYKLIQDIQTIVT